MLSTLYFWYSAYHTIFLKMKYKTEQKISAISEDLELQGGSHKLFFFTCIQLFLTFFSNILFTRITYKKYSDYLLAIFSQDMKEMKYLAPYFGMSDADIQQIQSTEKGRVISILSRSGKKKRKQ